MNHDQVKKPHHASLPYKRTGGQLGGAKPGAGRPPGSLNRLQKEAVKLAKDTGELPHEILLKMARGQPVRIMVPTERTDDNGNTIFQETFRALDVDSVRDAAKAAAPYFAPRLSTVETISALTDEQLDEIIAGAAAEAEIGDGTTGESEESESEEGTHPTARTRVRLR